MEGKSAEQFKIKPDHIRVTEDYAAMKSAVYMASKKVLEEMVVLHQLEEKHLIAMEESVQEVLIQSSAETIPELQAVALETVKTILNKFGIDETEIVKDFAATLGLEMKTF